MRAIHAPAMAILGIQNPELTQGTPEEQLQAMRNLQNARAAAAIITLKEEVPRRELVWQRYWIEHLPTGALLREFGGDPAYAPHVTHYYVREDGQPVMLEPADPPSRAELERRQQEKEQRRADRTDAAKRRREQMKATAGR